MPNTLFYGDNLQVLRDHVPADSVDLVYLDPPFNSNASYNVLFRERTGEESPAQIRAFTDTWEWTQETERTFEIDIIQNPAVPSAVKDMISAFRQFIGRNAMMAYLVMMAPRLVELHRVLKPNGSLYLHCDPTASHYLKLPCSTPHGLLPVPLLPSYPLSLQNGKNAVEIENPAKTGMGYIVEPAVLEIGSSYHRRRSRRC